MLLGEHYTDAKHWCTNVALCSTGTALWLMGLHQGATARPHAPACSCTMLPTLLSGVVPCAAHHTEPLDAGTPPRSSSCCLSEVSG